MVKLTQLDELSRLRQITLALSILIRFVVFSFKSQDCLILFGFVSAIECYRFD